MNIKPTPNYSAAQTSTPSSSEGSVNGTRSSSFASQEAPVTITLSGSTEVSVTTSVGDRTRRIGALKELINTGRYNVPTPKVGNALIRRMLLDADSDSSYVS